MANSYWEQPEAALSRSLIAKKVAEMMKQHWTNSEHENARRCCPTCGTPACNHPDRVRGEDALPIPPAALKIGADQLGKLLKHQDRATVEMIADSVFRSMLEACSK